MSALSTLAVPAQEPTVAEEKPSDLEFDVDYDPEPTARELVALANEKAKQKAAEWETELQRLADKSSKQAGRATVCALLDHPPTLASANETPPINERVKLKARAESQPAAVRPGYGLLNDLVLEADEVMQEQVKVAIPARQDLLVTEPSESETTEPPSEASLLPPSARLRRASLRRRAARTRSPAMRTRERERERAVLERLPQQLQGPRRPSAQSGRAGSSRSSPR